MAKRKTILVLHLAGQYPLAGIAWQALHYVLGLKYIGYDVYYVEDSGAPPYNPVARVNLEDCSYNVAFIQRFMERYDLGDHWVYWDSLHNITYGQPPDKLRLLYRQADAIINLCGGTWLREEHLQCPIRIYLETDPARPQIEISQGNEKTKALLTAHTHHFTYGENLGHSDCPLPVTGFEWKATRPPVVMELWPYCFTQEAQKFTTITTLEHPEGIVFNGEKYYWSKHVNFSRFQDLPMQTSQKFEIAAQGDKSARDQLAQKQWSLIDALEISLDLEKYQNYIAGSRGEFTVAKDVVVRTRSGWFSDRSVCYLASGKPVITQETGFSKFLPTGEGLFAFNTSEEALDAVRQINGDYARHCHAARSLAVEHFSTDRVLGKLLKDAGLE
jgi:hypothetical protein